MRIMAFDRLCGSRTDRRRASRRGVAARLLGLELLEPRTTPALVAFFSPTAGVLAVFGDAQDNRINVSRNAAGSVLVNGGTVAVFGGQPTIANTRLIQVFGQAGNDTISLDETNGVLPRTNLYGGAGNDMLNGGAGNDMLNGQAGNDTLMGKGGNDLLFGGTGDDTLTAGAGTDQVFGQAGNDRMIWNPGDGSDRNDGGAGVDTVEVNGGNAGESFTAATVGDRIRFDRVDPLPFSIDIGTSERLVVNMNGGDDSFAADGNVPGLVVDGGAGNDAIVGGAGNDMLSGGDGIDSIDGNAGNDVVSLGAGDDVFRWDPGDGSDTVQGQDGRDAMIFNGISNMAEHVDVTANGQRVRFHRDVANVNMDLAGVEVIAFNAMGGVDTISVDDLSATDVTLVQVNLGGPPQGAPDGQADMVVLGGTEDADDISVSGDATGVSVIGLPVQVNITGADANIDRLIVDTLGGDDSVDASGLAAGAIRFTAEGDEGDDHLTGGDGDDTLQGGDGDDILQGGPGNDILDGGPGDNVLIQD